MCNSYLIGASNADDPLIYISTDNTAQVTPDLLEYFQTGRLPTHDLSGNEITYTDEDNLALLENPV